MEEDNVRSELSDEDRKQVLVKVHEVTSWLEKNQSAEKEDFEEKQKELEKICMPVMSKLYQGGGAPGGAAGTGVSHGTGEPHKDSKAGGPFLTAMHVYGFNLM